MNARSDYTIRSEAEMGAVISMRNAILLRVKVQLQFFPTVTQAQFQEIVGVAWKEAQFVCQEIMDLYPDIEAHQRVGFKAFDCFDQVLSRARPQGFGNQPVPPLQQVHTGSSVATPGAPSPVSRQAQKGNELEAIGREIEKGLKEVGGALKDIFGSKKKR